MENQEPRHPNKEKRGLTPGERAFLKVYFERNSLTEAYLATHENCTRQVAGLKGYRLKERIIKKIGYKHFLEIGGISDSKIVQAHNELLQSNDEHVKMRAVKLGYEVRGKLVELKSVEVRENEKLSWTEEMRRETEEANAAQNDEDDDTDA